MVPTSTKDVAVAEAVAGVIHQNVNPELGEEPDLEGYCQREGGRDIKLGEKLPEDQRYVPQDLVWRCPHVFTDMPGETELIHHKIKLTDDTPIRCKPYPFLHAMREELRNKVDSMQDTGVMRTSTSQYASPIIMVKKKDELAKVKQDY